MSCALTAEPIEMQFGMLSQVGPGNVLHGDVDAFTGGIYIPSSFGSIWQIEEHCKA